MDLPELVAPLPSVSPEETLPAVGRLMHERQMRAATVMCDGKLLGLITEASLAEVAVSDGARTPCAQDVMIADIEHVPVSMPVLAAAKLMRTRRLAYLALVDDQDEFVGIVTLRRVLFEVMDELGLKVDNLERELMADGPGG